MSDNVKSAGATIWEWRMAIFWFCLFSVNTLCTSITAALVGADWAQLDTQSKLMIVIAVIGNWTGAIMAFVSKQAQKIQKGELPIPTGETAFLENKINQTKPPV